ncbi:MAG: T9SS type A sorting domain-containing protein [Bacteroidales bacterium]|jgi:hypothetical protein
MVIYGDVEQFDCQENGSKITGLDASHNDLLDYLDCTNCEIESLNISGCYRLTDLYCMGNKIPEIDLSSCASVMGHLFCFNNEISELDLSGCVKMRELDCHNNNISSLDVSDCQRLIFLSFYGNPITTEVVDKIYCDVGDNHGEEFPGNIMPLYNENDENFDIVMQTNKENATVKNWKVVFSSYNDIPPTSGDYDCNASIDEFANVENATIDIIPNPAISSVTISVDESISGKTLKIFDISGRLVYQSEAQNQQDISVSEWASGVCFVKIGNTTTKLIKQ